MPGPVLSPSELLGQLRLEAALLRGIHRLWSAQIQADAGEPLRDPRPEDVAMIFRVDPNAVLYRHGKWIPDPARPVPAPSTPTPPPANAPPPGN
jgi:hypothetical protein